MRENVFAFDLERKVLILFAVNAAAILLGPFGTYDSLTLWQRAVFWTLLFGGSFLCMWPVLQVFGSGRLVARLPVVGRVVGAVAVGSLPIAALTVFLLHIIRDNHVGDIWGKFPKIYLQVGGITFAIILIEFYLWPKLTGVGPEEDAPAGRSSATPGPESADASGEATEGGAAPGRLPPGPEAPPLSQRLPHGLRAGRIVSISMQDHYAHIVTTAGEALVLIRLSDAIALLDGLPGVQTHRSHWVAAAFAEALERDGRRHVLRLRDGRRLPVAASRLGQVAALLDARNHARVSA